MNILNEASNSQVSRSLSPSILRENKRNKEAIESLRDLADKNIFHKVEVTIGKEVKEYTSIFNWFNFDKVFKQQVPKKINFKCIVCGKSIIGDLGKPGNQYKHIKTHLDVKEWSRLYELSKEEIKSKPRKQINKKQLSLVKFFLTSNIAMEALENKHLRDALDVKLSKYSFKNVILPNMIVFLKNVISNKLIEAKFITLITDIWTNASVSDYLALGARIINPSFNQETLIIGMIKMPGAHNAENVKIAIESIVNKIKFNKAKISAIVTDEGSNLLRLFKQLENSYYIDSIQESNESLDYESNNSEENQFATEDEDNNSDSEDSETELNLQSSNNDEDDENFEDEEMTYNQFDDTATNSLYDNEEITDENDSNPSNFFTEKEILSVDIQNKIEFIRTTRSFNITVPSIVIDEQSEYDFKNNSELITFLELEIGSNRISRFSCACHKGNLAIRKAIKASPYFSELLMSLSKQATNIKKSIVLSGRHRNNKSKIHRQNYTRWSSSFMMLISYLKSYKRGIFHNEYKCVATEEEIEKYVQILLPMYMFTNDAQSNKASIACIVPSILSLIYSNLDRMILEDENQNLFRDNLIFFLKMKFEFELTSKIYLVAALLNVETLHEWKDRSYSKAYYTKGLDLIFDVVKMFEIEKDQISQDSSVRNTGETSTRDENLINNRYRNDGLQQLSRLMKSNSSQNIENLNEVKIQEEINSFIALISEIEIESTKKFWIDYKNKLPHLYMLALRLLCIPCASSSIESFFSISGFVNSNGSQIGDELLINRSLLKANFKLIEEFK